MVPKTPSPLTRFGIVPLAVAAALFVRLPLWPILGWEMPLLLLWPAVILCAWLGGLWTGLATSVLAAVAGGVLFCLTHVASEILVPGPWVGLLIFVALGGLASLALDRLHEARRDVEREARKLTAERDWLRAILAGMAGGVIVTDAEERVTYVNPVASALTGWGREDALGEHVNHVFHIISEKTRQTIEKPVVRVLRDGKAVGPGSPAILVSREGAEKRIEEWIAPVRSVDRRIVGAVITFHDPGQRRSGGREVLPGNARWYEPSALSQIPLDTQPAAVRMRVLVIADNRESADDLATLLRMLGHEFLIASSGQEAVRRASEWSPQLVLCDIGPTSMDRAAVATALRKDPATSRAHLIAISSDEDRQRCLQAGFDHHLTKPVDPQVLQTVIALQTLVGSNENHPKHGQNTA